MITLELMGNINDQGKLEVELPPGVTQGKVKVKIEVLDDSVPNPEGVWTKEELFELQSNLKRVLSANPPQFADLLNQIGDSWAVSGITDSVEFVAEQRRKN